MCVLKAGDSRLKKNRAAIEHRKVGRPESSGRPHEKHSASGSYRRRCWSSRRRRLSLTRTSTGSLCSVAVGNAGLLGHLAIEHPVDNAGPLEAVELRDSLLVYTRRYNERSQGKRRVVLATGNTRAIYVTRAACPLDDTVPDGSSTRNTNHIPHELRIVGIARPDAHHNILRVTDSLVFYIIIRRTSFGCHYVLLPISLLPVIL